MPGKRLTSVERAQIEVLFGQGLSFPQIAAAIGRDRVTVWREVRRHRVYHGNRLATGSWHPRGRGRPGGYRWKYCHRTAQQQAQVLARRARPGKLRPRWGRPWPLLWAVVKDLLVQRWSPVQIARWLRQEFPEQPERWVSHKTIYQAIFFQARGGMRQELVRQVALRSARAARKPQSRTATAGRSAKPWIGDLHISARPFWATDSLTEGDLVIGARGSSAIITLVERATRYVMLGALPHSRVSDEVIEVLTELRKTLTWDQGTEMAKHARFTLATDCRVYFCDPHSPWQRGSNENTNGLLRQYFPRSSTDFRTYTQDQLDGVARELNGRPRQTLDWKNPAQVLNKFLVATTT